MMSSGIVKYQNAWLKSGSVVVNVVGKLGRGMRYSDLEILVYDYQNDCAVAGFREIYADSTAM